MDYIFFRGSNPSDIAWLVARVCMLSIGVCQTLRDLSEHTHFCIQPTDIEVLKFRVIGSSSSKFILFCCPSAEPPSIYIIIYIVCTCIYTLVTCRELCVTACPTVPFILVTLYMYHISMWILGYSPNRPFCEIIAPDTRTLTLCLSVQQQWVRKVIWPTERAHRCSNNFVRVNTFIAFDIDFDRRSCHSHSSAKKSSIQWCECHEYGISATHTHRTFLSILMKWHEGI